MPPGNGTSSDVTPAVGSVVTSPSDRRRSATTTTSSGDDTRNNSSRVTTSDATRAGAATAMTTATTATGVTTAATGVATAATAAIAAATIVATAAAAATAATAATAVTAAWRTDDGNISANSTTFTSEWAKANRTTTTSSRAFKTPLMWRGEGVSGEGGLEEGGSGEGGEGEGGDGEGGQGSSRPGERDAPSTKLRWPSVTTTRLGPSSSPAAYTRGAAVTASGDRDGAVVVRQTTGSPPGDMSRDMAAGAVAATPATGPRDAARAGSRGEPRRPPGDVTRAGESATAATGSGDTRTATAATGDNSGDTRPGDTDDGSSRNELKTGDDGKKSLNKNEMTVIIVVCALVCVPVVGACTLLTCTLSCRLCRKEAGWGARCCGQRGATRVRPASTRSTCTQRSVTSCSQRSVTSRSPGTSTVYIDPSVIATGRECLHATDRCQSEPCLTAPRGAGPAQRSSPGDWVTYQQAPKDTQAPPPRAPRRFVVSAGGAMTSRKRLKTTTFYRRYNSVSPLRHESDQPPSPAADAGTGKLYIV